MNHFTWDPTLPGDQDNFAPGNLIAMEQGGRGGFEMRHNHGVKCDPKLAVYAAPKMHRLCCAGAAVRSVMQTSASAWG